MLNDVFFEKTLTVFVIATCDYTFDLLYPSERKVCVYHPVKFLDVFNGKALNVPSMLIDFSYLFTGEMEHFPLY